MKRKMSEEITRDEMLRLREQGYSNTEIAEQLECCYATVLKYIGKGGVRRKKKIASACAAGTDHEKAANENRLIMLSRSFGGKVACFTVFEDEIEIVFPDMNCDVTLKFDKYAEFAKDILAVSRVMG